jgi:hypothetical protein
MTDYLDTLQARLVDASRRLSQERRRRWKWRSGAAVTFVVSAGAPALAATGVWRPPIGDGHGPAPKVTSEAPPADQLAMLGVLRRAQTNADRSAASLRALRLISGGSVRGVRADSVRLLAKGSRDGGLVLVPVARYTRTWPHLPADTPADERHRLNPPPVNDALCLFQLDVDGAGVACWSSADVREGRAWMALGHRAAWIAPDGVTSVRTDYPHAETIDTTVHDNLALFTEPHGRHGDPTTTFLDARGTAVRVVEPPKPPPAARRGLPAHTDPVAPEATRGGGVRRVAISGKGLQARYELLVDVPKRSGRRPAFVWIALQRPPCAGRRRVTEMLGGVSSGRAQFDVHPSTGDFRQARWCPGAYRGTLRVQGIRIPFGSFSFRVRP